MTVIIPVICARRCCNTAGSTGLQTGLLVCLVAAAAGKPAVRGKTGPALFAVAAVAGTGSRIRLDLRSYTGPGSCTRTKPREIWFWLRELSSVPVRPATLVPGTTCPVPSSTPSPLIEVGIDRPTDGLLRRLSLLRVGRACSRTRRAHRQ